MANSGKLITCTEGEMSAALQEARASAVRDMTAPLKSKQVTGYYSTVRFGTTRAGTAPGPFTYTCPAIDRAAFSYAKNETLPIGAGYRTGDGAATLVETNLSQAGQTRAGETFYIKGISLLPSSDSDPVLQTLVWSNAACQLAQNSGDDRWPFGRLNFFPAVAGISGRGTSLLGAVAPPLDASVTDYSIMDNATAQNDVDGQAPSFSFKDPIVWQKTGETDSDLQLIFSNKAFSVVTNDRAAAAGVAPFTSPDDNARGTYCDVTVRFVGWSIANLSVNR